MTIQKAIESISSTRLATYKSRMNLTSDEECLGIYIWNKKLCGVFLPVLQLLEISLRNSIHEGYLVGQQAIFIKNGGGPTPPVSDRLWFRTFFETNQAAYPESWNQILQVEAQLQKQGRPTDIDRVISKLGFGFWSHLCSKKHDAINAGSLKLWPQYQDYIFPGSQIHGKWMGMTHIQDALKQINDIRNRIAHHEPIWHSAKAYGQEAFINKLVGDFRKCLDVINWINPSNLKTITIMESCTEFATLCTPQTIETYKQLGSTFNVTKPIDPQAWESQCSVLDRHNGFVLSHTEKTTIIKSLKDKKTFVLDKYNGKFPSLSHNELVNFKPTRKVTGAGHVTLLAQYVQLGHK